MLVFLQNTKRLILWIGVLSAFVWFYFSLPKNLFEKPQSTVLYSSNGTLLSAVIADDGQWRFPHRDSVPYKFKVALLQFEDKHFEHHSGVYLPSLCRALYQNVSQQKVVSGASTITMQTVRMSRNNPPRSILEKVSEIVSALRLEWRFNKNEILSLYASNAPYGGNVVGLDAAAWRYYGRTPEQLSWAESATLAVLPNAPALIFPGKNQEKLLTKRNSLLLQLFEQGYFDNQTYELACSEPLPQKPYPLPQYASHLLTTMVKKGGKGKRYNTTVDVVLQQTAQAIVQQHVAELEANLVHNAAVMVVEVKSGNVLLYVGNAANAQNSYGNMVDVIQAPRSTGSILKPFLYAAMLKDGLILPHSLTADIPMQFDGFSPQNFSETFDGAVPASLALSRSLNIPAVVMLKDYGYPRFYHVLKKIGFTHFNKSADHYGLSLILGGGEASLWDITHAYAGMSRSLTSYHNSNGSYFENAYDQRNFTPANFDEIKNRKDEFPVFDAASIWCTYQALLEVNRPETELGWEVYNSASPIAWKTGTSFGNRDAWAVGTTPEYVVGVWVGNADGVGRPLLTGVGAAAPLMFDIFSILPHRSWFSPPFDDLVKVATCHESGWRCGEFCEHVDSTWVPKACLNSQACRLHQKVFTNADGSERLSMECAAGRELIARSWFVLPPIQEYYYKTKHPEYALLPPFAFGCGEDSESPIGLIYPKGDAKIYVPRNIQGIREVVVLKATHRNPQAILYWYIDGEYLGSTSGLHELETQPNVGEHILSITDQDGQSLARKIEILQH